MIKQTDTIVSKRESSIGRLILSKEIYIKTIAERDFKEEDWTNRRKLETINRKPRKIGKTEWRRKEIFSLIITNKFVLQNNLKKNWLNVGPILYLGKQKSILSRWSMIILIQSTKNILLFYIFVWFIIVNDLKSSKIDKK